MNDSNMHSEVLSESLNLHLYSSPTSSHKRDKINMWNVRCGPQLEQKVADKTMTDDEMCEVLASENS